MRGSLLWGVLLSALVIFATSAGGLYAKTCKCDQHSADATAGGACSLTESGNYCAITFRGSDADGEVPRGTTTDSEALGTFEDVIKSLGSQYSINVQFNALAQLSGDHFSIPHENLGSLLTGAAAAAIPIEYADEVADDFGAMFDTESGSLREIVADFLEDGCVDAERGSLRVLIISPFSEKNGSCEENWEQ